MFAAGLCAQGGQLRTGPKTDPRWRGALGTSWAPACLHHAGPAASRSAGPAQGCSLRGWRWRERAAWLGLTARRSATAARLAPARARRCSTATAASPRSLGEARAALPAGSSSLCVCSPRPTPASVHPSHARGVCASLPCRLGGEHPQGRPPAHRPAASSLGGGLAQLGGLDAVTADLFFGDDGGEEEEEEQEDSASGAAAWVERGGMRCVV